MPKSSLTTGIIIGTALVGAGVAVAPGLGFLSVLDTIDIDDDDRPPIIVNNGTIELMVIPYGDPGSWEPVSQNVWKHHHTKKGGPQKYRVTIGGSNTGACPTEEKSNINKIELTATDGTLIDITPDKAGSDRFTLVNTRSLTSQPAGFTLVIGDAATKLAKIVAYKNTSVEKTCSYATGDTPYILIEQKR